MNYLTNHSRDIAFVGVLIACVILLGISLVLIGEYSDVIDDQVAMRVESNSAAVLTTVSERLQLFQNKATSAAGKIQRAKDPSNFSLEMTNLDADPEFEGKKLLLYYKENSDTPETDGIFFDSFDAGKKPIPIDSVPEIVEMIARGGGVSELFSDNYYNMNLFAFGAPVYNNQNADYVILCYPQSILSDAVTAIRNDTAVRERLSAASLAVVVDKNGVVLDKIKVPDNWSVDAPIGDLMNAHLDDDQVMPDLLKAAAEGENRCVKTSINGETHSVGVSRNADFYGVYLVTLYNSSEAYETGYAFVNVISTTVAILFVLMILFTLYTIVSRAKIAKMLREYGSKDPQLGCPTLIGMERVVPEVAKQFPGSTFALSVVEMKHFNYIRDTYGQEVADATLAFIFRTLKRSLDRAEIVGYLGDNKFVLMTHFKTASALMNRLRVISAMISEPLAAKKYNVKFLFGVCELERNKDGEIDVRRTISCCTIAMNSVTENSVANNVVFFNEVLKETYMQNADVETKMESALAAGEFRIFYQPKVNLHNNRCEGGEALIRWYDQERDYYRPPDTFLPLFEENGFIVKLDKHVFYTVCKLIADRVNAGEKVYPISVNISRLTALAPDFLDYYISIKKKFGIANKMVILEFTENIAHESYDLLNHLIETLHKNGFLCSIDDFGSGYASFNLLKSLPMDEIKLDRVFLEKGFSADGDRKVWESAIKLGQSLNLTVVQEGVETEEVMKYLTDIGCDVIQGYYYSKPIPTDEFKRFLAKCADIEHEEDQARQMASRLGF